jgi:hypothetical protein
MQQHIIFSNQKFAEQNLGDRLLEILTVAQLVEKLPIF